MSLKHAILDTTFVLPFFGIAVESNSVKHKDILYLWQTGTKKYSLVLPTPCLTEVIYKLNRLFRRDQRIEISYRYSVALSTLLNNPHISHFDPFVDVPSAKYSLIIREEGHRDLNDCFIAGTALGLGGILVTEDKALTEIVLGLKIGADIIDWSNFLSMAYP